MVPNGVCYRGVPLYQFICTSCASSDGLVRGNFGIALVILPTCSMDLETAVTLHLSYLITSTTLHFTTVVHAWKMLHIYTDHAPNELQRLYICMLFIN